MVSAARQEKLLSLNKISLTVLPAATIFMVLTVMTSSTAVKATILFAVEMVKIHIFLLRDTATIPLMNGAAIIVLFSSKVLIQMK